MSSVKRSSPGRGVRPVKSHSGQSRCNVCDPFPWTEVELKVKDTGRLLSNAVSLVRDDSAEDERCCVVGDHVLAVR